MEGNTSMTEALLQHNARMIADKYTFTQPVEIDEEPEAHTVWLRVGQQSFRLGGYFETKEHADWTRLMLARALARIHYDLLG